MEKFLNQVILGDCYKVIKEIPDKSVDLVYIDIPYLYNTGCGSKSKLSARIKQTARTLQENGLTDGIDYSLFDELCRIMKHIYIYIWCSREQIFDIMKYFVEKECTYNILTWCKTNPVPATRGNWLPDIEYCLLFKGNGTPRYNDGITLKRKWYVSALNVEDKKNYLHPTIKPLPFVKQHILHSTQPNDIVLDCFCGSGTTLVACKETGRQYIGIEINEKYQKIAVDRLNGIDAHGQTSIFTDFDKI